MNAVPGASVFLLAQNRLLREALARILHNKSDISVVGSCCLSPTAMEQIIAAAPAVLVMDSFTTNLAQLEFVRSAQQSMPGIRLVMIGMDPDGQHFLQAIQEGAMGYVLKDASALEVVAAVRAVADGDAVCPPQLCAFLFRFVARQNQVPNFHVRTQLGLTNREQQLVGLISRGLTNKEIAVQLHLAEQTVRNHVHRMLRKVGASHRLAVVEMCRMQGMPI
jgi:DNA-binding NarL/FixJ family response regulator